jgi:hypothetical protein
MRWSQDYEYEYLRHEARLQRSDPLRHVGVAIILQPKLAMPRAAPRVQLAEVIQCDGVVRATRDRRDLFDFDRADASGHGHGLALCAEPELPISTHTG